MKRAIIYLTVSLTLLIILLFRLDVFYIAVSPHNSHHLTETEKTLIENAVSQFRERVESGDFSEIAKDLSQSRGAYWDEVILKEIQKDRAAYGKPSSWGIFRVAQPQIDAAKGETFYHVDCLTKFANEEKYESFIWLVKNNEIYLFHTDVNDIPQATTWRVEERDRQKAVIEKYPGEIIIPYADRYIEIRY